MAFSNSGPFSGFLGKLDAEGKAKALISHKRPLDPTMAGIALTLSFITFNPVDFISNQLRIDVHL